jgi:hypothetical protein
MYITLDTNFWLTTFDKVACLLLERCCNETDAAGADFKDLCQPNVTCPLCCMSDHGYTQLRFLHLNPYNFDSPRRNVERATSIFGQLPMK